MLDRGYASKKDIPNGIHLLDRLIKDGLEVSMRTERFYKVK
jgi:hypothetical protein